METYRFGIIRRMVAGITLVSLITYGVSAIFIFAVDKHITFIPHWLFDTITLALGIIWSGILGWIAAKLLVKPILALTKAANQAARGELNIAFEPPSSDDELRTLTLAFSEMIGNLKDIVDSIKDNFSVTDQNVNEMVHIAESSAEQMSGIVKTIEMVAAGSARQSSINETMLESVGQLTSFAGEIQRVSTRSHTLSEQMITTIHENEQAVGSMIKGMNHLQKSNTDTMKVVERLDQHANDIGSISYTVHELAQQTHLLALNASIEAARAGEQGQGFSVVAREVQKLADQSASAVSGINEFITQIQQEIADVVKKIEDQDHIVQQEASRGTNSVQSLEQVSSIAEEVSASVEQLSGLISGEIGQLEHTLHEAREASGLAQEISSGAQEITATSQEYAAITQEMMQMARQLKVQSENLKKRIDHFR